MAKNSFPISYVYDLAAGGNKKSGARDSVRCDCPLCGGKMSMSLSTARNIYHCFKCDEAGDSVDLFAKVKKISNRESYAELKKLCTAVPAEKLEKYKAVKDYEDLQIVDIYCRDGINQSLLEKLPLLEEHKLNLINRGLTVKDIEKLKYKSIPLKDSSLEYRDQLAKEIIDPFRLVEGQAVPGFYDIGTDTPKICVPKEGILIPVRTRAMKISGFQIRYNSLPANATQQMKDSYHRYGWFTSGSKKTGTPFSGCENIHHAGNWYRITYPKVIGLTEGALKADIASLLYDKIDPKNEHLFLGLTGVGNVSQLAEDLNAMGQLGLEEVHIFVDMDYREKPSVARALKKIEDIITSCTYTTWDESSNSDLKHSMRFKVMTWNSSFKGIDDYLKNYYEKMLLSACRK